jgi:hypothetical protein
MKRDYQKKPMPYSLLGEKYILGDILLYGLCKPKA